MGLSLSRGKLGYMHNKFSQHEKRKVEVRLHSIAVPKCMQFRYLDLLFQENGMTDDL